jgi:hypothetical protein
MKKQRLRLTKCICDGVNTARKARVDRRVKQIAHAFITSGKVLSQIDGDAENPHQIRLSCTP